MVEKRPDVRIKVFDALNHKWFQEDDQVFTKEEKELNIAVLKRLKKFRKRSMLKHMALH
jgi:hypothetical protein